FGTGDGEFHDPRGIAFDSAGFIFVVDTLNHRVQKLDANATYFDQFGSQGQDDGQFDNPTDVVVDAAGYVYVKDAQRIQKFTNDGSFMTSWGQASTVPGRFRRPYGIAVNSQGYVFVSEFDNDRIQAFNPSGNYIASIGSGTFDDPFALAIDNSDNIFVVDH